MSQSDGFKPMLACDWYEEKLKFPCIVQPKLDGVHSLNRHGKCIGRSLKAHENRYITEKFSKPEYHGFCGEKINADLGATHPDLCRITSGDLRRHEGEPNITWYLFDYVTEETKNFGYVQRMQMLRDFILNNCTDVDWSNFEFVESVTVNSMHELLAIENEYLEQGYEGIIIRDPNAPYKYGRCGKTFMGCWRVKRFIEEEILVDKINEGMHNANEAKTNELGRTERSTHQENMQPNGLLGNMEGTTLKDIYDPQSQKLLIPKGERVTVSPGEMDHSKRKFYFDNPSEIVGHVIKFKMFPKGIKDKPRFPTYVSHRNSNDM
jgi:DNA ligase-1